MAEPVFTSSLSEEEMLDNFKNIDLFAGIMEALCEVLEIEKGSKTQRNSEQYDEIPCSTNNSQ